MEEWAFVDEGELLSFRGSEACMTCQHFTHGVDAHCHTLVACRLRQQRLADGAPHQALQIVDTDMAPGGRLGSGIQLNLQRGQGTDPGSERPRLNKPRRDVQ